MKKKLLSILLALCGAFVFTACGGGNGDSVVPDNSSTPAASTPTDSTPADTTPAEPVLQDMDTAFSGAKILWEKSHLSAMNSPIKTFEEIVDRQLELLAQDLIYRLTYVYGDFRETSTNVGISYTLSGCQHNGNSAVIDTTVLLADDTCDHNEDDYYADCLYCYQKSLNIGRKGDNAFFDLNHIYLPGAISGKYTSLRFFQLLSPSVPENMWLLDIETDVVNACNSFKMAFAQMLSNQSVDGNYDSTKYTKLLEEIDVLVFDQDSLVNFIKTVVVGQHLMEKDARIENDSVLTDEKLVDNNFMINAPYPGNTNYTDDENENSPRLYKGYSIIIPAIVERALANTFENTDVCIYPVVNRYAVNTINHYQIGGSSTMREAVLMPKAGEVGTLTVFVEGNEDFTLSYDVAVNGVVTSKTAQVVLTDGKATVDLDISETFGAYNGNANSYTDDYIYGNSGADSHGDNYILFYYDREDMHLWFKGVK